MIEKEGRDKAGLGEAAEVQMFEEKDFQRQEEQLTDMHEDIELAFVGDFAPTCEYAVEPSLVTTALGEIRRCVGNGAALFVNLECSVRDGAPGANPTQCSLDSLAALEVAKPVVVNLANNHFFDGGADACDRVRSKLLELGIPSVGVYGEGRPVSDIVSANARKIGVVCRVARGTNPASWGGNGCGIERLEPNELIGSCKSIRGKVDLLIVSLHWGAEYYTVPSPWQRKLAGDLLDVGVDIVWGHHAHVLQPRIMRGRQLIMYNLGNFLFGSLYPGRWPIECRNSAIVRFRRHSRGTECVELPLHVEVNGAMKLANRDRNVKQVERLSRRIGCCDYLEWFFHRIHGETFGACFRNLARARAAKRSNYGGTRTAPSRLLSSFSRRLVRAFRLRADE